MDDHRLFPLIDVPAAASSVSLLDTMLLGGGRSSLSTVKIQPTFPAQTTPSGTPYLDGWVRVPFVWSWSRTDNCARLRNASLLANFMFRARSFSTFSSVLVHLLSCSAFASQYRLRDNSETWPTISSGTCRDDISVSDSSSRMIPCVETRSLIMP